MRNTDDFLIFYQLIEHGSFSKAADHVGLTKSVVSKRITRLEHDLGVQLLYRTTRKLTLTEAGNVFYRHAREIHLSVLLAEEELKGLGQRLSGHIKITVPTISGELILPEAIAEFSEKYPDITIQMDLDNRFIDILADGYDLAIRTGILPDSSFIARRLADINWIICGAPKYFSEHGTPKTHTDLQNHNCLGYSFQETGAFEWLFKGDHAAFTVNVTGNFSTNNTSALKSAAMLGQGLIYVPKVLVFNELESNQLVEVLSEQVGKRLGIYAVYPYTKHLPEKTKLFIDHIHACYEKHRNQF